MATSRARTPSQDLTRMLVDAALRVLAAGGPDEVTVRRVASSAGVAPMGVYSRFGGKHGLLEALLVDGFVGLRAAVSTSRELPVGTRLTAACAAYRHFALDHPHQYRLMFEQMPRLRVGDAARATADAAFRELVDVVEDAVRAGVLRPAPPESIAQCLWSAAHGAVCLELGGLVRTAPAAAYDELMTALLAGLAPPGRPGAPG